MVLSIQPREVLPSEGEEDDMKRFRIQWLGTRLQVVNDQCKEESQVLPCSVSILFQLSAYHSSHLAVICGYWLHAVNAVTAINFKTKRTVS